VLKHACSAGKWISNRQVLRVSRSSTSNSSRPSAQAATGYGTVGVRAGKPFLDVRAGRIDVARIAYTPHA
jgi:hypothetical protein